MEINRRHYQVLFVILLFYLVAQLFQQYVLRLGVMSGIADLSDSIVAGQSFSNKTRLTLVLLSLFLMFIGYAILCLSFYSRRPVESLMALIFFAVFCGIEVCYRSVELFFIVFSIGNEFANGSTEARNELLPIITRFNDIVSSIYFPLLLAHLMGSIFLMLASRNEVTAKLVTIAMAINSIRLLLRLAEFTPFGFLNIFGGPWYFPPVAVIFVLLIAWTWKKILDTGTIKS